MKIIATKIKGSELEAGDLFSTVGPFYWEHIDLTRSIGERVYIRTTTPSPDDREVYRITIEKESPHREEGLEGKEPYKPGESFTPPKGWCEN